MTIEQAKEVFMISRRARNLSKNTMFWYNHSIDRFVVFCGNNQISDIRKLKQRDIELFISELQGTMRAISLKDIYTAIRTFFTYLFDEEYLERNPMKNMKPPKVDKKIMRTFTKEEIGKILKYFDQSNFFGLRNHLIMCMLFSTGMRKSELLNLRMQDINVTLDMIKVKGKGSKERLVPIGRTLRRVMLSYISQREEFLDDTLCDYFIVSYRKRQLTPTGINLVFKKMKTDLGWIGERISSHTMRHTFCKTFLMNNGDLFTLQRIVGHSDLRMTRKYVELNDREIKIQYAKANPLDNNEWTY